VKNPPEYPEHEKLAKVRDKSQAIGEFLEWASEKGWHLAYYPEDPNYDAEMRWVRETVHQILAKYFGIDLKRLEDEKRAMLEWIREADQ
jgi:hypothetical protein